MPGLDQEGFVAAPELRARALQLSPEAFVDAYPAPALLVLGRGPDDPATTTPRTATRKTATAFQIMTLGGAETSSQESLRQYDGRVAFLLKRPGNPFPNMISIGRAASCDIVVALETVSKVHGYFLREPDGWAYTDYRSTNGTWVNDKRVEKGERRRIEDRDALRIGLDLRATFLAPSSLYERLRGG